MRSWVNVNILMSIYTLYLQCIETLDQTYYIKLKIYIFQSLSYWNLKYILEIIWFIKPYEILNTYNFK